MGRKTTAMGSGGIVCAVGTMIVIIIGAGHVRTNEAGLKLIGGYESCRKDPYKCPANKWTDGIGNTTGVKPGVIKTDKQIAEDWQRNILVAESCINKNFRGAAMSTNAFSAMTSAAFNMGCENLTSYYSKDRGMRVETSIHKWAQLGNWVNMCHQLNDFTHSGGKELKGLVLRRNSETDLCLTPDKK